jgi:hypothetical protein
LWVEYKEIEIIGVILAADDDQQILPDFAILNGSFQGKPAYKFRLFDINNLYLLVSLSLKCKPLFIQRQHTA